MRGFQLVAAVALASLAAACGNHAHDEHEWTAEELAELEHKWGMEVSYCWLSGFLVLPLLEQLYFVVSGEHEGLAG